MHYYVFVAAACTENVCAKSIKSEAEYYYDLVCEAGNDDGRVKDLNEQFWKQVHELNCY